MRSVETKSKEKSIKEDGDLDILVLGCMQEWPELEKGITVDSGAVECVMPSVCAPHIPIKESDGSKKGSHYVAVGGARIPNVGQERVTLATQNGQASAMTFQTVDINNPFASVSEICKKGHRVVFGDDGSFTEHKLSGKKIYLKGRNGVYVFGVWIMPMDEEQVFVRQG